MTGKHARKQSQDSQPRPRRRRAVVLLIVLVVVAALSLSAYSFTGLMIAQYEAANLMGQQVQARWLVNSGVESIRLFLAQDEATQVEAGGTYDNPLAFQGLLISDDADPVLRGRYTVIASALNEEGELAGIRYGLQDESTRLNLNALILADAQQKNGGRELLMALPGMTEQIADAILDWIDEDDEPREFGAEVSHYSSLVPAYAPKNGPLETVEELLLVRGVLPQLLFGFDVNRNGAIDATEVNGDGSQALASTGVDNSDGTLDLGWSAYLTLYSQEKNETADGQQRIYVNSDDLEQLYNDLQTVLDNQWATFIIAYRQNGPYVGSEEPTSSAKGKLDFEERAKTQLVQVLDLVDAVTEVTFEGDEEPTILASPIRSEAIGLALPLLMDNLTTNASPTIPGRININQAPSTILMGIPGMKEEIVNEIISRRDIVADDEDPNRRHETWILAEAIVELDEMRTLLPYVNVGGNVHRAQIVGYFERGGASSRAEVVLDGTQTVPRVLFWRDMSHLGRGYDLETLGVELAE